MLIATLSLAFSPATSRSTTSANLFYGCRSAASQGLPYCNTSLPHAIRAADLVSRLSLTDKIAQLSPTKPPYCACHTAPSTAGGGVPQYRWLTEVNSVAALPCVSPGRCPTQFIGPLGTAASFNDSAWRAKGDCVSTDVRAVFNAYTGSDAYSPAAPGLTGFGPNINTVRDPRYGRNSELAGEDPYLSGRYAISYVAGMQQMAGGPSGDALFKMRAYLKHYTAYSVETDRFTFSAPLSDFDLHDSNLPQYEMAMTVGNASGAMCSYFAPNGVSSCGNDYLLNGRIRGAWKRPDAVVMSDCSAVANMQKNVMNLTGQQAAARALNAGLDVYGGWEDNLWGDGTLQAALAAGLAAEATLDAAVTRAIRHKLSVGLFDPPEQSPWAGLGADELNSSRARAVAYDLALQGAVLLQNERAALPLVRGRRLAVLGPLANDSLLYLSDYAKADVVRSHPSLLDTLRAANGADALTAFAPGTAGVEGASPELEAEAVAAAARAEQVVLVLGITKAQEHESIDRADTLLPAAQAQLALRVLAAAGGTTPVAVVLVNGGILSIDDLVAPRAAGAVAIVEAFSPAGQGPRALGALLYGAENRWGKLPVTVYPRDYAASVTLQNMSFANRTYRYYTGEALFRFGDGLSLTTFAHDCTCASAPAVPASGAHCCCALTNTGPTAGDEVLMVFHAAGAAVSAEAEKRHPVPLRKLVDFARLRLAPGETTRQCFATPRAAFALTNATGGRTLYPGEHELIFSRGNGREVRKSFAL